MKRQFILVKYFIAVWLLGAFASNCFAMTLLIQVPKAIVDRNTKLKIKNKTTGREKSFAGKSSKVLVSTKDLRGLGFKSLDTLAKDLEIAFWETAYLMSKPMAPNRIGGPNNLQSSLVFDRPFWRNTGFKRNVVDKKLVVTIHSILPLEIQNPNSKGALTLDESVKKLFEIGWKSYKVKRYDLGLEAFEKLLDGKRPLKVDALSEAYLGRAVGRFHQRGCSASESDFVSAGRDPRHKDDADYYKALCMVERKEHEKAQGIFQSLVDKNSERYAEPSRLYLGVVAEALENFDAAELAYLDTKDFASDPSLVKLAEDRLKLLKAKKEAAKQSALFVGALGLALGYDTNVVNLPQELSASDFSVSNEKSGLMMFNSYLGFNPKLSSKLTSSLSYSGLVLHHFAKDIADRFDVQSHEAALSFSYQWDSFSKVSLGGSFGSVFLGTLTDFDEYMRTPAGTLGWQKFVGPAEGPTGMWNTQFKFTLLQPQTDSTTPDTDSTANGYLLSVKYSFLNHQPHLFGPSAEVEYKPAKGKENSYYSAGAGAHWGVSVGPESWGLYAQNDFLAKYSDYFETTVTRKDYLLQYTGSLAKPIGENFEAKFQLTQTFNFSTNKASFQYDRTVANIIIGAIF